MKEIIWIFGTSASGKQTFIKNVLADKDLAIQLGWEAKKITACQESLDLLGHIGQKEIVRAREKITEIVPQLLMNADVILIKWQYIDSKLATPQKIKDLLPSVEHKIILLKADDAEVKKRLAKKTWWKEIFTNTDFADREVKMVATCIKELNPDFPVTTLDSNPSMNYKPINK